MEERLQKLKKRMLDRVSDRTYYGLIDYVGEIYSGDYDLVVIMARKFSNLYLALLPLVRKEYLGHFEDLRKRREEQRTAALVISDRALDVILADIREKKGGTRFKRVRIADDIIIHGTSMRNMKSRLETAFKEAGVTDFVVDITAYGVNLSGLDLRENEIKWEFAGEKFTSGSWRYLSGEIVDILYIMGQPYTSYVPNATILMDSPTGIKIGEYIKDSSLHEITDTSMKRNNCRAYVWAKKSENEFELCVTCRIYEFEELRKYILVPMVSINPIDELMIEKYISALEVYVRESQSNYMKQILTECSGEYKYRCIIYILSALEGWHFIEADIQAERSACRYDETEEKYNFLNAFLCSSEDSAKIPARRTLEEIDSLYIQNNWFAAETDFGKLDEDVADLEKELTKLTHQTTDMLQENLTNLIGKYLHINSELDEEKLRNMEKDTISTVRRRTTGLPLVSVIKRIEKMGNSIENIFYSVFCAIDFGKGSIIPKIFLNGSQKIYAAVLHPGEQNYRYFVDNYFPVMYGMYHLESELEDKAVIQAKETLWNEYKKIADNKMFWDSDRNYLVNISMRDEFEEILVNEAFMYKNPNELNEVIKEAQKLINGGLNGGSIQ